MGSKRLGQFSAVLGIRSKLGGTKGTLVIAREFPLAVCGCGEVHSFSHDLEVYARMQKRLKTELRSLPLSDPKTIADRTYGILVSAGQQFASSLGAVRKQSLAAAN